ncbi:unnamed protein product [Brugia timori]|uniref:Innexin n=1 Tax=Brugia timori TaxID=42155 RepID=A0A0R3QZ57_9BILA|nr:unnamed protein product [Brugia timori]
MKVGNGYQQQMRYSIHFYSVYRGQFLSFLTVNLLCQFLEFDWSKIQYCQIVQAAIIAQVDVRAYFFKHIM